MPRKIFTCSMDELLYNRLSELSDRFGVSKSMMVNLILNFCIGEVGLKNVINDNLAKLIKERLDEYERIN